jgi:hypothetical protein
MWTCPKCRSRWNNNKLRCTCGRKQPKRRPSHRQVLKEVPYERWVEFYGERCGICGAGPGTRRLHRDHDHKTGAARGILCFRCNTALPNRVDAEWLRAAADYLDRASLRDDLAEWATDPGTFEVRAVDRIRREAWREAGT